MKNGTKLASFISILILLASNAWAIVKDQKGSLQFNLIGRYVANSNAPLGASEIVQYAQNKMFVINGVDKSVDIINLDTIKSDRMTQLSLTTRVALGDVTNDKEFKFGDVTSLSVHPTEHYFAVAVQALNYQMNGKVFFVDFEGKILNSISVGVQPDMLIFSKDGKILLVANEGEPREGLGVDEMNKLIPDPEGTVSYIDLSVPISKINEKHHTEINFRNVILDDQVIIENRNYHPDYKFYEDLEPEYITIDNNAQFAYVSLQENNAIAKINLETKKVEKVQSLGYRDFSKTPLDYANNGKIEFEKLPLLGIHMPDGITYFEKSGKGYIFTANEGDAREWGKEDSKNFVSNELKLSGFKSAPIDLNKYSKNKIHAMNDLNKEGTLGERIYIFGSRSFSVFDAQSLMEVAHSGDDFERITASLLPKSFNASNDNNKMDDRSGKKGPEPEEVKIGSIDGNDYLFIGLERIGGVMAYNINDPLNARYDAYINTRDFTIAPTGKDIVNDSGPEGMAFVQASESPTKHPLLFIANETSGTTLVFEVTSREMDK